MTKTQCLLVIWSVWTITGPLGGVACTMFCAIIRKSFSKYIEIFRQTARETLSENGLDSYVTERGTEIYAMVLFIMFTIFPIIGWVGLIKGISGYVEGYKEGREHRDEES